MRSIGIIGGSVIGLATAEAMLEDHPGAKIIVYSEEFSPHTTADVSAGLFIPYLCGENDDPNRLKKWMSDTISHILDACHENDQLKKAMTMISGYRVWKNTPKDTDPYKNCYFGWRRVSPSELNQWGKPGRYSYGAFYTTWLLDCSIYLPCLMKKLTAKGVQFVEKRVSSLDTVADWGHDVVVNTTGYGAKFLTGDQQMKPLRGQILIANAPWVKHFFMEVDGDSYIIPKSDYLVVGGTHDRDTALSLNPAASKNIWSGACDMLPSLRMGSVTGERVGIRPGRTSVRMDIEQRKTKLGKYYTVLHHYGHGGYGVTCHWGCAKEASAMLQRHFNSISKL